MFRKVFDKKAVVWYTYQAVEREGTSEPKGERVAEASGAVLENDIEKNEERTVRF